jgi:hypothetical protein
MKTGILEFGGELDLFRLSNADVEMIRGERPQPLLHAFGDVLNYKIRRITAREHTGFKSFQPFNLSLRLISL